MTPHTQSGTVEHLRHQLSRLSPNLHSSEAVERLTTGLQLIDQALPASGLACSALHEFVGDSASIVGFLAVILGRNTPMKDVLWIGPSPQLYAHGLAQLGLSHERLTIVQAQRADDRLWAAEECLRELRFAAVVLEVDSPDLTDTRRLQLATEKSGGIGFVLRRYRQPSAALTRWCVEPAPSNGYRPCLRLVLERCRAGQPGSWLVEWDYATLSFSLASDLAHRPLAAAE